MGRYKIPKITNNIDKPSTFNLHSADLIENPIKKKKLEKTHHCWICGKSFTNEKQLNQHNKTALHLKTLKSIVEEDHPSIPSFVWTISDESVRYTTFIDHIDKEYQAPTPTPTNISEDISATITKNIPIRHNPTLKDPRKDHGIYQEANIPQELPEEEAEELVNTLMKLLTEERENMEEGEIINKTIPEAPTWTIEDQIGTTIDIDTLLPPIEVDYLEFLANQDI